MIDKIRQMIEDATKVHGETIVAAKWWSDWLRNPDEVSHDNGEIIGSVFANWTRDQDSRNDHFDPDKVDEFEKVLAEKIQEKIQGRRTWDYQTPYKGQTFMKCDYHADPLLQQSAEEVGLEISSMTTFPIKTSMWINPGEVRVKNGYSAGIETIWEIGEYVEDIREIVSDWTYPTEDDHGNIRDPEPRVFPTDDGYLIRAYGEYDPGIYGPESREFKILNKNIEEFGLEDQLEKIEMMIKAWREQ